MINLNKYRLQTARCILCLGLGLLVSFTQESSSKRHNPSTEDEYFKNPIKKSGADPWMIYHDGYYYYTETPGNSTIYIIKSKTITDIGEEDPITVWRSPPQGEPGVKYNIWGPHLNFIKGDWYIYYAAQSVKDPKYLHQRMWVLKSKTGSPLGPYENKGEVLNSGNTEWAIDGSVLARKDGSLYFVWSGMPNKATLFQATYMAKMESPEQIDRSTITKISSPTAPWETSVRPIQEGQRPLFIDKNGKSIIMYSANASWSDEYCLASLTNESGDFLNPKSWKKSKAPLFAKTESVFGPGGASYVPSPDGTESWIIYHAAKNKGSGWNRNIRAQRFTWDEKGNPIFGEPVPVGVSIKKPSGE